MIQGAESFSLALDTFLFTLQGKNPFERLSDSLLLCSFATFSVSCTTFAPFPFSNVFFPGLFLLSSFPSQFLSASISSILSSLQVGSLHPQFLSSQAPFLFSFFPPQLLSSSAPFLLSYLPPFLLSFFPPFLFNSFSAPLLSSQAPLPQLLSSQAPLPQLLSSLVPFLLSYLPLFLPSSFPSKASFIQIRVQSASAGHVHQNSSAHVARRRHLEAAAVLAHGSPQTPIGV